MSLATAAVCQAISHKPEQIGIKHTPCGAIEICMMNDRD